MILKPSSSMSKGSDFTKIASKDIRSRPFDHIVVNVAFVANYEKEIENVICICLGFSDD